jgi:uncharacterized membrane protein YgcG
MKPKSLLHQQLSHAEWVIACALAFAVLLVGFFIVRAWVQSVIRRRGFERLSRIPDPPEYDPFDLKRPSQLPPPPVIPIPMPEGVRRQAMRTLTGLGRGGLIEPPTRRTSRIHVSPATQVGVCLSDSDAWRLTGEALNSLRNGTGGMSTSDDSSHGGRFGGAGGSDSWDHDLDVSGGEE